MSSKKERIVNIDVEQSRSRLDALKKSCHKDLANSYKELIESDDPYLVELSEFEARYILAVLLYGGNPYAEKWGVYDYNYQPFSRKRYLSGISKEKLLESIFSGHRNRGRNRPEMERKRGRWQKYSFCKAWMEDDGEGDWYPPFPGSTTIYDHGFVGMYPFSDPEGEARGHELHEPSMPSFTKTSTPWSGVRTEEVCVNTTDLIHNLRKACDEWIEEFWDKWDSFDDHPWPWPDKKPKEYTSRLYKAAARTIHTSYNQDWHPRKHVQFGRLKQNWVEQFSYDNVRIYLDAKTTAEVLGVSLHMLGKWRKWHSADAEQTSGYTNSLPYIGLTRPSLNWTTEIKNAWYTYEESESKDGECIHFTYSHPSRASVRVGRTHTYSLDDIEKWLEDPHPQRVPSDHIYLMTNESMPGLVKVGRSKDVEKRRKSLSRQSHVPTPFVTAWSLPYIQSFDLEKAVHAHFDSHRANKNREFFRTDDTVTPESILQVAQEIALREGCAA